MSETDFHIATSEDEAKTPTPPWMSISLVEFLKNVARNDDDTSADFRLRVNTGVYGGIMFSLDWTGADGQRYHAEAPKTHLLLQRAHVIEMSAIGRREALRRKALGL